MKLNKILTDNSNLIIDYLKQKGVHNYETYCAIDTFEDINYYYNLKEGYDLLSNHLQTNKEVALIVDCDCDGILSSAISLAYLQFMGVNTHLFSHDNKLHGLDDKHLVDKIKQSNIDFIIIPDASGKEDDIADLTNCGKKILCLDHHPTNLKSTDNFVCINNKLNMLGNHELSGTGVAWKFFWQYCYHTVHREEYPYKLPFMDLVGLSIISDSCSAVPLENKYFINQVLNNTNNKFLKYLITELVKKDEYNAVDLAFNVIPKINASVRSGDTELQERMVRAFANLDDDFETLKNDMVSAHRQQSTTVKNMTDPLIDEAKLIDDNLIILTVDDNSTYTGLVANKLMSAVNKPVLLVHETNNGDTENLVGSARSPINNFKSLCNDSDLFNWNAGHECAFGTSFKKHNISKILKHFNSIHMDNSVDVVEIFNDGFIPNQYFDEMDNADRQLWCTDIPEPVFAVKLKNINGLDWKAYRGNTIKLYHNGVSYMKFRCSNKIKEQLHIGQDEIYNLTLVGTLCYNDYNGKRYPQMMIEDFEVTSVNAKPSFEDIW